MTSESKKNLYVALGVCVLLMAAVVLVFGQTARFEFVNYDDNVYVYNNPHVARGLTAESVAWAFTTFTGSNWHPMTWLSHMLDSQLFGHRNAAGPHLTNVALHAAVVVSLFLVLWRMTGSLWPSALVALVFAVHPLRAESVAWVSERKDLLSGLFFMLTLVAYLGYVRHPFSWRRYLLVVAVFALGLTAKPMLVTLPCVMLLLDYWPLGRTPFLPPANAGGSVAAASTNVIRRLAFLVVEKLPLFALALGSSVLTSMAQQKAMASLDAIPVSMRIGNALVSITAYIGQLFYPVGLAIFYPYPQGGHPLWKIAAAACAIAAVSAVAWIYRRKCPYLLVGWLWYLGMLMPVIGLVQVGSQAMADRYTYLPQIGLTIALVWGAAALFAGRPVGRWAFAGGSVVAAAALILAARQQTATWRDGETLWTNALNCTEHNMVAHNNLAMILANRNQVDDAIEHYRKAVDIQPERTMFRENLGGALEAGGKIEEAEAEFRKAKEAPMLAAVEHYRHALKLSSTPASAATIHNNLGGALASLGRTGEAIAEYREALKLKPDYAEAHNNLGNVLAASNQTDAAIAAYRKALEFDPNYANAHGNLGAALAGRGRFDEAVGCFRIVLESNPENAAAHNNLGMALQQQGKTIDAVPHWREAIRLDPTNVHNVNRLAWALATSPDASVRNGSEAVELGRWAVQLSNCREAVPFDTLAAAYAEKGHFPEALAAAKKALQIASRGKNATLVESIRKKIVLYESHKPFREEPEHSSTVRVSCEQTAQTWKTP